jgi:pimeloyl-ACP methyl ester carboxylesterase
MRKFLLPLFLILNAMPILAQDAVDLADPDGQFIEIDGVSIYYIEKGEVENPVVLLLHGFGGSTFTWRDNIDSIAEAGYRVIAFDRPPYGLSDKSTEIDYTSDYYAGLTASLMDALDIQTASLVGHSAGGGVIASFAATYPERVDALVFVAGAVAIEGEVFAGRDEQNEDQSPFGNLAGAVARLNPDSPLAKAAVRALITPDTFAGILTSAYYNQTVVTAEVIAGYQRPLQVEGWEGAFLKLFASRQGSEPLKPEAITAFTMPTLIIWGEEDTWVPLEAGERLKELIPAAELIVYPEVGHLPMEENVEAFNTDVIAWLETAVE